MCHVDCGKKARFCSKRPELEAQHFYFPTRLLLDQTCLDIPGHNRMLNRASLGKWFSNILPQSHREGLLKRWRGPPSGFLIPEIWDGTWELEFLTSEQVMLKLPAWEPHFENRLPRLHGTGPRRWLALTRPNPPSNGSQPLRTNTAMAEASSEQLTSHSRNHNRRWLPQEHWLPWAPGWHC